MLMVTNLIGFGVGNGVSAKSLYGTISAAGLTSNLKLCLDAADSSSYSGSGQPWLDRSAGGYDFNRGATSGSESSDPTFNGSAGGLSSNEYWSFDGGDYFTYDSANETWMDAWHKDSAAFSFLAALWVPDLTGTNGIIGTGSSAAAPGIRWELSSLEKPVFRVKGTGGAQILLSTADTALTQSAWNILGLSINEAGASGFHYLNGAYNQASGSNTFDATYTSPSAAAAAFTTQIGSVGNAVSPLQSTVRMGFFAAFDAALSKASFDAIYTTQKERYGLT